METDYHPMTSSHSASKKVLIALRVYNGWFPQSGLPKKIIELPSTKPLPNIPDDAWKRLYEAVQPELHQWNNAQKFAERAHQFLLFVYALLCLVFALAGENSLLILFVCILVSSTFNGKAYVGNSAFDRAMRDLVASELADHGSDWQGYSLKYMVEFAALYYHTNSFLIIAENTEEKEVLTDAIHVV